MRRNEEGARSQQHTHAYERVSVGTKGWEVYRCMLPNCTHFVQLQFIAGKLSLCYGCGSEVVITKDDVLMKRKRFFCESCRAERKERLEALKEIV